MKVVLNGNPVSHGSQSKRRASRTVKTNIMAQMVKSSHAAMSACTSTGISRLTTRGKTSNSLQRWLARLSRSSASCMMLQTNLISVQVYYPSRRALSTETLCQSRQLSRNPKSREQTTRKPSPLQTSHVTLASVPTPPMQ